MRLFLALLAALLVCTPLGSASAGSGALGRLEKEFKGAIDKVTPATVTCVAKGSPPGWSGSSGVLVSRSGLVLSDGDPGFLPPVKGRPAAHIVDVEVRVPNLKKGGYTAYDAKVLRRDAKVDTSLLQIQNAPARGFPDFLQPGASDDVQVGSFTFVMGNAFNLSNEGSPSLTAGVIANLVRLPEGDPGGHYEFLYSSAAVNPGVNGGPVVDSAGRLIGTVSTWARAKDPHDPFQFLAKIIPIDRVRPVYEGLEGAKKLFPKREPRGRRAPESHGLETVLHHTALQSFGAVVSIQAKRPAPVSTSVPGQGKVIEIERYEGPFSGVLADREGHVVTSLYNLTNIVGLLAPGWDRARPEADRFDTGLHAIEELTVFLSDGTEYPATLLGHHQGLGVAVLKADLSKGRGQTTAALKLLEPAAAEAFRPGVFVLALGNPFGMKPRPDPLLTFGILSKQHPENSDKAWRGNWQTDAAVTDGNCGGAVVDIDGRLLGVLQLWNPAGHGRNSGLAFIVPWPKIVAALPRLIRSESFRRPFLGIQWSTETKRPELAKVIPKTVAGEAGLLPKDLIIAIDDKPVTTRAECQAILMHKWSGDALKITVRRGEKVYDFNVVLGERP